MLNNVFFLLLFAQTIATEKTYGPGSFKESELNYNAELFVPNAAATLKNPFEQNYAPMDTDITKNPFQENDAAEFDDVASTMDTDSTDYRSYESIRKSKRFPNPNGWTSDTFLSQYGYNPSTSVGSFSNPNGITGSIPNQFQNSNARFTLDKPREFETDEARKNREESERKRLEFLANDPASRRLKKIEKLKKIFSEEILQYLDIIDEEVRLQKALRARKEKKNDESRTKCSGDDFRAVEVERDEDHESLVQKQNSRVQALIGIIEQKYSSNSYISQWRVDEFSVSTGLKGIQEWFQPAVDQSFAEFEKYESAAKPDALKALTILVPKWNREEKTIHWKLTKFLAGRLGINLSNIELVSSFMAKHKISE